jgi:hypothetical protein
VVVVVTGVGAPVVVVVTGALLVLVVAGVPVVVVVTGALLVLVGALLVRVVALVVVARWCQDRWLGGVAPEVLLTAKELMSVASAIATTTPPARVRRRRIGEAL